MTQRGSVPTKQAALLEWAGTFNTVLQDVGETYFLSVPQILAYKTAFTAYQDAYNVAITPATRTKSSVLLKDQKKSDLLLISRSYAKMLLANNQISDQAKVDIGLKLPKTPAPIPVPQVSPTLKVTAIENNMLSIVASLTGSTSTGLPHGCDGVVTYVHVGTSAPTDPSEWSYCTSSSRMKFTVAFPATLPGGTKVFVTAAFKNAKDENGAACSPVGAMLLGAALPTEAAKLKIAA